MRAEKKSAQFAELNRAFRSNKKAVSRKYPANGFFDFRCNPWRGSGGGCSVCSRD